LHGAAGSAGDGIDDDVTETVEDEARIHDVFSADLYTGDVLMGAQSTYDAAYVACKAVHPQAAEFVTAYSAWMASVHAHIITYAAPPEMLWRHTWDLVKSMSADDSIRCNIIARTALVLAHHLVTTYNQLYRRAKHAALAEGEGGDTAGVYADRQAKAAFEAVWTLWFAPACLACTLAGRVSVTHARRSWLPGWMSANMCTSTALVLLQTVSCVADKQDQYLSFLEPDALEALCSIIANPPGAHEQPRALLGALGFPGKVYLEDMAGTILTMKATCPGLTTIPPLTLSRAVAAVCHCATQLTRRRLHWNLCGWSLMSASWDVASTLPEATAFVQASMRTLRTIELEAGFLDATALTALRIPPSLARTMLTMAAVQGVIVMSQPSIPLAFKNVLREEKLWTLLGTYLEYISAEDGRFAANMFPLNCVMQGVVTAVHEAPGAASVQADLVDSGVLHKLLTEALPRYSRVFGTLPGVCGSAPQKLKAAAAGAEAGSGGAGGTDQGGLLSDGSDAAKTASDRKKAHGAAVEAAGVAQGMLAKLCNSFGMHASEPCSLETARLFAPGATLVRGSLFANLVCITAVRCMEACASGQDVCAAAMEAGLLPFAGKHVTFSMQALAWAAPCYLSESGLGRKRCTSAAKAKAVLARLAVFGPRLVALKLCTEDEWKSLRGAATEAARDAACAFEKLFGERLSFGLALGAEPAGCDA
jgi:hypothetical protein